MSNHYKNSHRNYSPEAVIPKRNQTFEITPDRRKMVTPEILHKDLEKLYKKDVLPNSPNKLKCSNFSEYLQLIKGYHKITTNRKNTSQNKASFNRQNSPKKPNFSEISPSLKIYDSPHKTHANEPQPKNLKKEHSKGRRQPGQGNSKKKVDDLLLLFIKEGMILKKINQVAKKVSIS